MSKFDYVTGYLPYVSDRDIEKKQLQKRLILLGSIVLSALLIFFFWGANTSAQDHGNEKTYDVFPFTPAVDRPIWSSLNDPGKPLVLAKNTNKFSENSEKPLLVKQHTTDKKIEMNSKSVSSDKSIEISYQEDLEKLLNKAFSK